MCVFRAEAYISHCIPLAGSWLKDYNPHERRRQSAFFLWVGIYIANPHWELVKQWCICAKTSLSTDSLESRDAISFPHFPPDFRHSSSLLHPHHDDSQLPCKHHKSLKHVRPDDGLQTTLSRTAKTHGNYYDTCQCILFSNICLIEHSTVTFTLSLNARLIL